MLSQCPLSLQLQSLNTYSGSVMLKADSLTDAVLIKVDLIYISEPEIHKGEDVFDSNLISSTHYKVPCLVLNLKDRANSSINYRIVWSGSPVHAGIINPLSPDLWTAQGNPEFDYTKPLTFNAEAEQSITLLACGDLLYITGSLKIYREDDLVLEKEIDVHL